MSVCNSYEFFTSYFQKEMEDSGVKGSNDLKGFLSANTEPFEFDSSCPNVNAENKKMFFMDPASFKYHVLYYQPRERRFVFLPDNVDESLLDVVQAKDGQCRNAFGISSEDDRTVCSHCLLNQYGLLAESYNVSSREIRARFYPRESVIQGYRDFAEEHPSLEKVAFWSYETPLSRGRIFPRYHIVANEIFGDKINVKVVNVKSGETVAEEFIDNDPSVSIYEAYSRYISGKIRELCEQNQKN